MAWGNLRRGLGGGSQGSGHPEGVPRGNPEGFHPSEFGATFGETLRGLPSLRPSLLSEGGCGGFKGGNPPLGELE